MIRNSIWLLRSTYLFLFSFCESENKIAEIGGRRRKEKTL